MHRSSLQTGIVTARNIINPHKKNIVDDDFNFSLHNDFTCKNSTPHHKPTCLSVCSKKSKYKTVLVVSVSVGTVTERLQTTGCHMFRVSYDQDLNKISHNFFLIHSQQNSIIIFWAQTFLTRPKLRSPKAHGSSKLCTKLSQFARFLWCRICFDGLCYVKWLTFLNSGLILWWILKPKICERKRSQFGN